MRYNRIVSVKEVIEDLKGEPMKHRMDLANQIDQSRKVKRLEAERSRLLSQIQKLKQRIKELESQTNE